MVILKLLYFRSKKEKKSKPNPYIAVDLAQGVIEHIVYVIPCFG